MIIETPTLSTPASTSAETPARLERNTRQRRAIREVFVKAGRPLSPAEVLELAKDSVPGLGIATVYRTLKGLLDEKWLAAVRLPGEPDRYEPAGSEPHTHFLCRTCNKAYEAPGALGDLRRLAPRGFKLEGVELTLIGQCNDCCAQQS